HRFQGSDEGHHGPWLESAPGQPGLSALAIPWSGGRAHKDAMRRLDRAASTIVLVRDVAEGRVTSDARGEPLIQYHLSSRDRRNLTHGLQEAARILRAAGALRMGSLHLRECSVGDGREPIRGAEFDAFIDHMGRLGIRENGVALFSAHPMGSARAGTDPKTSAAKPTGESHDVRNLWIGDGSLLPTAPGVNPMISIMALAARSSTPSLTTWAVWAFEKTEWPCSPPIRWVPLGREPTRRHRLRNRRASRTMCGICGSAMEASCRPRRA